MRKFLPVLDRALDSRVVDKSLTFSGLLSVDLLGCFWFKPAVLTTVEEYKECCRLLGQCGCILNFSLGSGWRLEAVTAAYQGK